MKTLSDIQTDAVRLAGLIEGIDHLDNEGHDNARTACIAIARQKSQELADEIDALDTEARK